MVLPAALVGVDFLSVFSGGVQALFSGQDVLSKDSRR
jgi:hypothetical protein